MARILNDTQEVSNFVVNPSQTFHPMKRDNVPPELLILPKIMEVELI